MSCSALYRLFVLAAIAGARRCCLEVCLSLCLMTVVQAVLPCCVVVGWGSVDDVRYDDVAATCCHARCDSDVDDRGIVSCNEPIDNEQPHPSCPYCEHSVVAVVFDSGASKSFRETSTSCVGTLPSNSVSLPLLQPTIDPQIRLRCDCRLSTLCRLQV